MKSTKKGKKKKLLEEIVAAWESLEGDRNHPASVVETWLSNDMAPAMNNIRKHLKKNDRKKEHVGLNDSEGDTRK